MIFDKKPTWKKYINVKKACQGGVTGIFLRSDYNILMHIKKTIICSKIDYGFIERSQC